MPRNNQAHARALVSAALFAAAATSACNTERERTTMQQQAERDRVPTPATPGGPDVEAVKDEPGRYYDKQVRLAGEVDGLLANRVFELEGSGWAFNDNIYVLMKQPMESGAALTNDDEVIVNGTVRHFVVADIEREIGWDLPPDLETKLRDRPVLLADTVRKVAGEQQRVADAGRPGDQQAGAQPGMQPGQQQIASVAMIVGASNPKQLAGQRVNLDRETVQAVVGKGLWIGPSGAQQIFVVPMTMPDDVAAGDTVAVSGTLREAPENAADAWGLPADAAKALGPNAVYLETVTLRKVDADERRN